MIEKWQWHKRQREQTLLFFKHLGHQKIYTIVLTSSTCGSRRFNTLMLICSAAFRSSVGFACAIVRNGHGDHLVKIMIQLKRK